MERNEDSEMIVGANQYSQLQVSRGAGPTWTNGRKGSAVWNC